MANSFYGTGRRKTSVARVTLTEGTGKFTFNGKDVEQYFPSPSMKMTIEKINQMINVVTIKPLVFSQCFSLFDIFYSPYRLKNETILILKKNCNPKNIIVYKQF